MSSSTVLDLNADHLKAIADAFPVPVMVISEDGYVLQTIGDEKVGSYHHIQNLRGKAVSEIWPEEKAEGFLAMIKAVIDDGTSQSVEYWLNLAESNRCYEAHVSPMRGFSANSKAAVLWVAFDVTERKRMEAALQSRDQLLDGIAHAKTILLSVHNINEAIPRALATIGHASRIEHAYLCEWHDRSKMFVKHFEWSIGNVDSSRESALNVAMKDVLPEWAERLQQNGVVRIRAAQATGSKLEYLEKHKIRSMILLPIWVHLEFWGFLGLDDMRHDKDWEYSEVASLRVAAGSIGAYILNKRGEELLKQAKTRADAANAAKGEFLAMMSHEIRTPMNSILGFADLLEKAELGEQEKDYVDIINRSGKALLELINNILDFSKIESRGIELDNKPFNLELTMMEALELMLVKAKQKGVKLDYEIAGDDARLFIGDADRLRQILINLVSNAVKFTDKGGVSVKVKIEQDESDRYNIVFRVEDSGLGIAEDKIDRLFQPFSQIDVSKSRRHGGTGLGLVICKRLVSKMGGDIGVESKHGEGSTFYFNIVVDRIYEDGPARPGIDGDALINADFYDKHPLDFQIYGSEDSFSDFVKQLKFFGYKPECVEDTKSFASSVKAKERPVLVFDLNESEAMAECMKSLDTDSDRAWVIGVTDELKKVSLQSFPSVHDLIPRSPNSVCAKERLIRAYQSFTRSSS